jgi:fluoride exporter
MLKDLLIVSAGGGLGAALRYLLYQLVKNEPFPYGTLLINIAGSFAIGMILAFSLRMGGLQENLRLFLATGICGGFTTFSAFSLENMQLLQAGRYNAAFLYILLSVACGLTASWVGFKLINT